MFLFPFVAFALIAAFVIYVILNILKGVFAVSGAINSSRLYKEYQSIKADIQRKHDEHYAEYMDIIRGFVPSNLVEEYKYACKLYDELLENHKYKSSPDYVESYKYDKLMRVECYFRESGDLNYKQVKNEYGQYEDTNETRDYIEVFLCDYCLIKARQWICEQGYSADNMYKMIKWLECPTTYGISRKEYQTPLVCSFDKYEFAHDYKSKEDWYGKIMTDDLFTIRGSDVVDSPTHYSDILHMFTSTTREDTLSVLKHRQEEMNKYIAKAKRFYGEYLERIK